MAVNVGVAGATGRIATTRHLPALHRLSREGLVGRVLLLGRDPGRLAHILDRFPEFEVGELSGALSDDDVDVILDATPPHTREDIATQVVAHGKHLLCEKPLGLTVAQCSILLKSAAEERVVATMVRDKLFTAGYLEAARMLARGELGDVLYVCGEFGYWVDSGMDETRPGQRPSWNYRSDLGGDIISDLFTHWSYMLELVGRVDEVSAVSGSNVRERRDEAGEIFRADVPETLVTIGTCADVVPFRIDNSWVTRPPSPFTMHIHGSLGSAHVAPHAVSVDSDRGERVVELEPSETGDEFVALWRDFIGRVEVGEPDVTGLEVGVRAAAVCASIARSLDEGMHVAVSTKGVVL